MGTAFATFFPDLTLGWKRTWQACSRCYAARRGGGFAKAEGLKGTDGEPLMEEAGRLTEQLALKSCLQARLPIGGDATCDQADDNNYTSDNRIQNLRFRPDQVF